MNIKVTNKLVRISLMMLSCVFCISMVKAQPTYNFYPNQSIYGNNDASLVYDSNNSEVTRLGFRDKEKLSYGGIYGSDNGANFGLVDAHGNWTYRAVLDDYTLFKINDIEMMRIEDNGNIGIGTLTPNYKLDVCGIGRFKEILVEETWCDYVFEPNYKLTTLQEESEFIKLYGHLSNFESAKEMDGMINVNDIFKRQQVQIEENVLHLIELKTENNSLRIESNDLSEEVVHLTEKVNSLTTNYELLTKELAALKALLR